MALSRVVILNDTSRANGGTAVLAMLSARLLRERGLEVVYACGDNGDAPDLKALGIEVLAAGSAELLEKPKWRSLREGIHDPSMTAFVSGIIRRFETRGTIFHLHGWAQIFSPAIFAALRPVAPKVLVHAHDLFLACPNGVYMDYQKNLSCGRTPLSLDCVLTDCDKRSYPQKLWRVARQANLKRLFVPQDGWAGIVQIHPGMTMRLTRAGYPESFLHTLRNPTRAYTDFRVPAEENDALLYVGRLEADKGPLELAQAAARVGMRLICVGDGRLRGELERNFPNVEVTGWLKREAIAAYACQARALVMPSHHPEPFALVLPEAAQSGLPLIVSRSAFMAPEIEAGGLGLAFDPFDSQSFDQALLTIRDMPADELRGMSERGFARETKLGNSETEWLDGLLNLYYRFA